MKYVITVKHTLTGVTTGFNLNITKGLESISTSSLLRIKEIMDTDFVGFYITEITLEDY